MKKFIKNSLFFVLFFILFSVVLNSVFLGIIAYTDWDFVKRRESLNFNNPHFELLVLGTSLAEYGIDTELLTSEGIESYNLALVGGSAKTAYIQLKEYLTKYSIKPEYVLFIVNTYLEEFTDKDIIQPVVEFTMKNHKYGVKDIPISKFNWAGMEIIKKILKRGYKKTYLSLGQKKALEADPDNTNSSELYLNIEKIESAYWIGEVARLCSHNKVELIVVEIPGFMETQNLSDIGPYTLHFNSNQDSAVLYNLNNQNFCNNLDIDPNKDWAGMSHLNKFGAAKFTRELIRIIKK